LILNVKKENRCTYGMFVYTCGVDQNVGPAYLETSCMRLCQGWRERRPWATWLLSRWLPLLLFYVFYFI